MTHASTKVVAGNVPAPFASGILPSQAIRALASAGGISSTSPLAEGQIQPASVDLRLGPMAYRVRASFLPSEGRPVADRIRELALHSFEFGAEGKVLEVGCVYIVPLLEGLELPGTVSAIANPKSSTGRLDVFTRVIADGVPAFDTIPAGFKGQIWLEICPQSFPVIVREGTRLAQLRFRSGLPEDGDAALADLHARERLVSEGGDIADGIRLSVDLAGGVGLDDIIGYRAKRHSGVVDVDRPGSCEILDFWEPIYGRGARRLILDPDQFYILASKEAVNVPPTHAAEMTPFNPLVGEFRVHYAGFMDPGFGYAAAGGTGSRIVLEVRSHKVPFILEHGQIIGRLVYERLTAPPDQLYGRDLGSNYQAQGLKLSKHFR
ncbi:MAG: 2'-deoxycytidine 5'-triphosphate deaminase [Hyphomicrobiaceae bacterium]|nr:2'-deoxycytidine 5'-triphosphate deaminase [Hyphomicrobiaceae bacterium]